MAAEFAIKSFGLSRRRACALVRVSRTIFSYAPKLSELNEKIRKRLKQLAAKHRKWGAWKFWRILRREGLMINHKRVERIYRQERLSLRERKRKKLKALARVPLPRPVRVNQQWSMDFIHDKLWDGRKFRSLSIVDTFTHECLALEVDTSLGGERVKRALEKLSWERGLPEAITVDNGPEFISQVMDEWAYRRGVKLDFIRPGKPTDNAFVESFHDKFRDECLNENYFLSLAEARTIIEDWRIEFNTFRPHRSLKGLTPEEFKQQNEPQKLYLQVV
jgi:putative transposase